MGLFNLSSIFDKAPTTSGTSFSLPELDISTPEFKAAVAAALPKPNLSGITGTTLATQPLDVTTPEFKAATAAALAGEDSYSYTYTPGVAELSQNVGMLGTSPDPMFDPVFGNTSQYSQQDWQNIINKNPEKWTTAFSDPNALAVAYHDAVGGLNTNAQQTYFGSNGEVPEGTRLTQAEIAMNTLADQEAKGEQFWTDWYHANEGKFDYLSPEAQQMYLFIGSKLGDLNYSDSRSQALDIHKDSTGMLYHEYDDQGNRLEWDFTPPDRGGSGWGDDVLRVGSYNIDNPDASISDKITDALANPAGALMLNVLLPGSGVLAQAGKQAAITLATGGDIEDAAIAALTSGITTGGPEFLKQFGTYADTGVANAFDKIHSTFTGQNFANDFVRGAFNETVTQAIRDGEIDPGEILKAGGINVGTQMFFDMFGDTDQTTPGAFEPGVTTVNGQILYEEDRPWWEENIMNTTDLRGLLGPDGALSKLGIETPFMPTDLLGEAYEFLGFGGAPYALTQEDIDKAAKGTDINQLKTQSQYYDERFFDMFSPRGDGNYYGIWTQNPLTSGGGITPPSTSGGSGNSGSLPGNSSGMLSFSGNGEVIPTSSQTTEDILLPDGSVNPTSDVTVIVENEIRKVQEDLDTSGATISAPEFTDPGADSTSDELPEFSIDPSGWEIVQSGFTGEINQGTGGDNLNQGGDDDLNQGGDNLNLGGDDELDQGDDDLNQGDDDLTTDKGINIDPPPEVPPEIPTTTTTTTTIPEGTGYDQQFPWMMGMGEGEWEDFMSGINVNMEVLDRLGITPQQYLASLFERMK